MTQEKQPPYSCPYAERIVRIEANLPDNFREEWGELRHMVKSMHDSLHENGYASRIQHLEENWSKILGMGILLRILLASGALTVLSAGIFAMVKMAES